MSYFNQPRPTPSPYIYTKQPFSMIEPNFISIIKSTAQFKPPAGLVETLAAMEEEDRQYLLKNPNAEKGINFAKKDVTHYKLVENYQLYPNLYNASTFNDVAVEYTFDSGKFVRIDQIAPLSKIVTSYVNIYAHNPLKYMPQTNKFIEEHFNEVDVSKYEVFIKTLYEKCYRIDIDESKITKQIQYLINKITMLSPKTYTAALVSTLKKCFKEASLKHSVFEGEVPVIYDITPDTKRSEIKDIEENVAKTKEYYKNSCRFLLAIMDLTYEMIRPTEEEIYKVDPTSGSLFSDDQTTTLGRLLFKFIKNSVSKTNILSGYNIIINNYAGKHHDILIESIGEELKTVWFNKLSDDGFSTFLLKEVKNSLLPFTKLG